MTPRPLSIACWILLIGLITTGVASAADDAVTIAFEKGLGDFKGQIAADATVSHGGSGSGKIVAELDEKKRWVTASLPVDLTNTVTAVRFWTRSSDVDAMAIRFTDATGQHHQQYLSLTADGQWHQTQITSLTKGKGYKKWGGSNDGTLHWPLTKIDFIVEKSGTLWLDDVELVTDGKPQRVSESYSYATIADFEGDLDGFSGQIAHDPGAGEAGGAAKMDADFTKGGRWITATTGLSLVNEFKLIRFRARSDSVSGMTFRLVDSTGQTLQKRPTWPADGQWHEVAVPMDGTWQKWDGANDGKIHWPAVKLSFIVEAANVGESKQGTLWIDSVEAGFTGKAQTTEDLYQRVVIADFNAGVGGFGGPMTHAKSEGVDGSGAGKIDADFSGGTRWVTSLSEVKVPNEFKQIRFMAKSQEAKGVTFRIVDATGQTLQAQLQWPADGQWHPVKIASFSGWKHWDGANDGKVHWPLQKMGFVLEKTQVGDAPNATLLIDDLEALVDPNRITAELEVQPARLGNIFYNDETLEIPVETKGDHVTWSIVDFWGATVASGGQAVVDNRTVILPELKQPGHFTVTLEATLDGQPVAMRHTTLAVIRHNEKLVDANSPFGVMTHFAQGWDIDIMPLIAKAGITTIRDELYWDKVEPKPGQYVFPERFVRYMDEAKRLGIRPLIVMSFANPNYDNGHTPYTPEACAAYGRYGQAILERFGDQIHELEIWNEYNGSFAKGPATEDRPRYYGQMLQHAFNAIREKRPDIKVLGGAAVLQPLPWFEGLFKHDVLKHCDALVIHPYRAQPEGIEQEIRDLRALASKYGSAPGSDIPIWVTETGRIDKTENGRYRIARYLARMYTLLLTEKVEAAHWYLLRDYDQFFSMGLCHDGNSPLGRYAAAPAYVSYANLIHQLAGSTFVKREATQPRTRVYHFDQKGEQVRVCWATNPATITLQADGPLTVVDLMGRSFTLTPVNGEAYLTLSDEPMYVRGAVRGVAEAGRFTLDPVQTIDVLDDAAVRFTLGDAAATGEMIVGDRRSSFAKGGVHAVTIADEPFRGEGERTLQYRLTLGGSTGLATGGKLAGMGTVTVKAVDGLVLDAASQIAADGQAELQLSNRAASVGYDIESVTWQLDGGSERTTNVATTVAPGGGVTVRLPLANVAPYVTQTLRGSLQLRGRDPVKFGGSVSHNPIARTNVQVDGRLSEWRQPAVLDGRVWIGWDARRIYFAGNGGEQLIVGLASAADNSTAWREFTLPLNGDKPAAASAATVVHAGQAWEAALPWSAISGIDPSQGAVRVALVLRDASGATLEWGQGITLGKDPQSYHLCHLVDDVKEPSASTTATVLPRTIAHQPQWRGRVVADAADDYSNVHGRDNWWYGYIDGLGGGEGDGREPVGPYSDDDFKPMEFVTTMWGYVWQGPHKHLSINRDNVHPQVVEGRQIWAVRRWKSSVDGEVRISGRIGNSAVDKGDGVMLKVLVDGRVVYSRLVKPIVSPGFDRYEFRTQVREGSLVDIALTCGAAGSNADYDATLITTTIEAAQP